MSTDYDTDERSTAGSRPIDLYTITTPTVTYRLTSYQVDVTFGGNTYTATTMSRGNLQLAQELTGRESVIYLPISHPLVQRYVASGLPEHGVEVTLVRLQSTSGQAKQQWSGFANALSFDGGHVAAIRVPSFTDDALKVRLPVIGAQRLCNHRLGDTQCTVDLVAAQAATTIFAMTGTSVTLLSSGSGDYHVFGVFKHVATQQLRLIIQQTADPVTGTSTVTLDTPLVGAALGDAVIAGVGCDHRVQTCGSKFSNVINFGGHPDLNATINPWAPNGYGVTQQI